MDASTENQNRFTAIAFTLGLHFIFFLLFVFVVFVTPIPAFEKGTRLILEWSNGSEGAASQDPVPTVSGSASSSRIATDPSEKDVFIKSGLNEKQNVNGTSVTSDDERSSRELLNALAVLKGKRGKDSKETDNKEGNDPEGLDEKGGKVDLSDRSLLQKPDRLTDALEEGIVVVDIRVDETGKVIKAIPGQRGSTTFSSNLYAKARQAALGLKFNPSKDAPKEQRGTYTFVFTLE